MDTILKYFPELNNIQKNQIAKLHDLYNKWNQQINVISRKDIEHLYIKHVLHSLSIAKIISFIPGSIILDVGTGGGFPGIPLAILFPSVKFHLIDSVGKKIKVVEEISKEIEIKNVKAEKVNAQFITDKYDFVISRAVTAFPEFEKLVRNKFSKINKHNLKNGIIYLKGGDFDDEIKTYIERIKIFEIQELFSEEFFKTKKIIYLPG